MGALSTAPAAPAARDFDDVMAQITIEARVCRAIRRALQTGILRPVRAQTRLREDLRADSLDMMIIAMSIEDAFDIALSDDAVAAFDTVASVVAVVAEQLAAKGQRP